ncbi:hypothetical protein RN001_013360 [Aquatica leii]|uniref:Cytochrome P450 n=1 Tax=Aquatica leii TaxID=1421715 RepID=A0AAN7NWA7_9COLE|nr:hypothetical protein RN001_013360 [Aquatica leii]
MLWFVIIGVLLALLYYKTIKPILYWKGRGVVYKKSYPIVGSLGIVLFQRRPFFNYVIDLYREFSNERYFGVYQFGKSALYIRDLDLIKKVAVTDFNHFTDHNSFTPTEFDPHIKRSMINLEGQRWRDMRATLSPSFTSNKMKIMFNLLSECAEDFTDYFDNQAKNIHEIEMKDIFTRFTNDAIATTAFGLKCNSVQNNNDEFYLMARKVTNVKGLTFLVFLMYILFPNISRLRMTSQSVSNFFRRIIKETIRQREKENFFRPDMIHLLMEARKGTNTNEEACLPDTGFATAEESNLIRLHNQKKIELSDDDIAAQVLLFIFGGIDTTSALLSFTAYELAINPSIQESLQNEVDDTLSDCNGKLTYEVLNKMKYMDMVISETLRKWPPGFQNDRICVKDYTIEPLNSLEKPLLIEKGTLILFPVSGIHHDPQYFPNPEVYDPERFNDENRNNIKPCSYIPFGVGPRNCIASRFALMESKVLMFHLLSKFNITRIERTPVPLKIAQATINFVAEGGFWLGLEPRMLPKYSFWLNQIMLWFLIIGIICLIVYYKAIKPLSYWKDRGVACKNSYPIVGSFSTVLFQQQALFYYVKEAYQQFSKERYFGVHQFRKPALYIKDIELIKKVAIKDFDHFSDHSSFTPTEPDSLIRKSLINLHGQRWRDVRATLSPSFTSSKMKIMFQLVSECAQNFINYFEKQKIDTHEIEIRDVFTRFTNDAIATIAFGLKSNSVKNKNDEFYLMAKKATSVTRLRFFIFILYLVFPKISRFLKLQMTPSSVRNFFRQIIKETVRQREKEGLVRPDMIHLLMEARKGNVIKDETHLPDTGFATVEESNMIRSHKRNYIELSEEDMSAQAVIFIFAGLDTSASLMSFTAYELAINPKIQGRLQQEVDDTLSDCNGNLTYEALHKMNYMDMIISETLRKWTPGFQNDRICVKDYKIDPVHSWEKPLLIEKGTLVLLPIAGIHYDPQYFPNPEVFDPERFNDENKHSIEPFSYLPFGVGPRSCIASRFALMESKIIIFNLLSKFNIVRIQKTPDPIKIAKATLNFVAEGGFWLGLKRRIPS